MKLLRQRLRSRWVFMIIGSLALLVFSNCRGGQDSLTLAPLSSLPDFAQNARPAAQQAYQFAAANPELLENQPCYCGCNALGHLSNKDCYISDIDEAGAITFESHASGCGICVDITQDVMRLTREGQSQLEIRQYIDETYSKFGPSTDTPLPKI